MHVTRPQLPRRRVCDGDAHAHFVTFSCYKRRRLLDDDRSKAIVVDFLSRQLGREQGVCIGFVVMPDHVHALVWFGEDGRLSQFMCQWKRRSSMALKDLYRTVLSNYGAGIGSGQPMWQAKYYGLNVFSDEKMNEKLEYMHNNPVRAGLAGSPEDWGFSSARWYLCGESVGVRVGMPG